MSADPKDIFKRGYCEQIYDSEFENIDEMDKFHENPNKADMRTRPSESPYICIEIESNYAS
jgi:hypothetical protein